MIVQEPINHFPNIDPTIKYNFILGQRTGRATLAHFTVSPMGVFGGIEGGRGFHFERMEFVDDFVRVLHLAREDVLTREQDVLGFSRIFELLGSAEDFRVVDSFARVMRDWHRVRSMNHESLAMQMLDHATELTVANAEFGILEDWMNQHERYSRESEINSEVANQFHSLVGASSLYGNGGIADRWARLHDDCVLMIGRH